MAKFMLDSVPNLKSIEDVDALITQMSEVRNVRKGAEKALENGKAALKAYMEANRLEAFKSVNTAAAITKMQKRRFDMARFKAEKPRIYAFYCVTEEYEQIRFDTK